MLTKDQTIILNGYLAEAKKAQAKWPKDNWLEILRRRAENTPWWRLRARLNAERVYTAALNMWLESARRVNAEVNDWLDLYDDMNARYQRLNTMKPNMEGLKKN